MRINVERVCNEMSLGSCIYSLNNYTLYRQQGLHTVKCFSFDMCVVYFVNYSK